MVSRFTDACLWCGGTGILKVTYEDGGCLWLTCKYCNGTGRRSRP